MIVIREIHSFDLLNQAGELIPILSMPLQDNVEIYITVTIGFSDTDGEDIFESAIITGVCRNKYYQELNKIPYEGRVFMYEKFSPVPILDDIRSKIIAHDEGDKERTLESISRIMAWEFDGL